MHKGISFCCSVKVEESEDSGNEDSDDSSATVTDDTSQSQKSKKAINKGRWSKEEDERLKQLVEEYVERWDKIAELFPDRSDVQCQQRWTKVVNPELVKGPWTKEVRKSSHLCFFDWCSILGSFCFNSAKGVVKYCFSSKA